jgi:hypothetical protein
MENNYTIVNWFLMALREQREYPQS